jgi:phosphatidate cytidylyltransferase
MSELAKRALTGAAYVALTLGAAWTGPVTTTLLFLPVCGLAAREMHRLTWGRGDDGPPMEVTVFSAVAACLLIALSGIINPFTPLRAAFSVLFIFLLASVDILFRKGVDPAKQLGALLITLFYIALPFGIITWLLRDGPWPFIGFMLLLWTNDTGAYLVGRFFGRTKLLPLVSPKKTVEGLIGGVLLTVGVSILLSMQRPELSMVHWAVCAVVVAFTSTLGDLLESAFKRAAGVKDSGDLLPGHGGILDRFDGFLLAAPAMLACVRFMG